MTDSACKTAPHRRIPSYCEFATHTSSFVCVLDLKVESEISRGAERSGCAGDRAAVRTPGANRVLARPRKIDDADDPVRPRVYAHG
jgi:hypothetical protein